MVAPPKAAPALTYKRRNWLYFPAGAFADYLAPTTIEWTAASALDITRMTFRDGTGQPTQAMERVQALQRLGDDIIPERKGPTTVTGGTITFAVDPQAVAASTGKKLWEMFRDGPDGGFLGRRLNVPRDTDAVAGQFVTIYPADINAAFELEVGEGAGAEVGGASEYVVRDVPAQMIALA